MFGGVRERGKNGVEGEGAKPCDDEWLLGISRNGFRDDLRSSPTTSPMSPPRREFFLDNAINAHNRRTCVILTIRGLETCIALGASLFRLDGALFDGVHLLPYNSYLLLPYSRYRFHTMDLISVIPSVIPVGFGKELGARACGSQGCLSVADLKCTPATIVLPQNPLK